MNDRTYAIANVGQAEKALAAEARAIEQARRGGFHTGELTEDDLRAAVENKTGVISIGGNSLRYSEKQPAQALHLGADNPERLDLETTLNGMGARAQFLTEQLRQCTDGDGNVRPGFEVEHRRAALQLESLQRAAAYEEFVRYPERRARAQAERGGAVEALRSEAAALDRRQQDAAARAFEQTFGRITIR